LNFITLAESLKNTIIIMENQNPPYPPPPPQNPFMQNPMMGGGGQMDVPNATAVLVLGICSIVTCFCWGIVGLACGIIALVLAGKGSAAYSTNPSAYKPQSFNVLKAGRICAIIGTVLSGIYAILTVWALATGNNGYYYNNYYNW
jgi:hypothetical protein